MTLDEFKKLVHDFGVSPTASRTCSNKNDMKRTRIGSKEFVSHQIYLLEKKTDGSFYFKTKHPDLKMSQRTFESYTFLFLLCRERERPKYLLLPVTHWGPFIFFKMYGIWQEKLVLGQLRL